MSPALEPAGAGLARLGLRANWLTWAGFASGVCAVGAIAAHDYWVGLGFIVLNRLLDGLDGPVARHGKVSNAGAYLDLVLERVFYVLVPFAFALAMPGDALAAAFLILALAVSSASVLAYAIFTGPRNMSVEPTAGRGFYGIGNLVEGTETFVAFIVMCILPQGFSIIAYIFGTLCFMTGGGRIAAAVADFRDT